MRVDLMLQFMNPNRRPDAQLIRDELDLAVEAEAAGFDAVWTPEHHFADFSIVPDPLQVLTWIGARTSTIQVGTAALILPWWQQPIRLAERIGVLDAMTNGRVLVGFGRGLAPSEFKTFGVPFEESRARFDEMSMMLVDALRTGYIEGNGQFFPQTRTEVRPHLNVGSFEDRIYSVALTVDSARSGGRLGATMMSFATHDMSSLQPCIAAHREEYMKVTGKEPSPVLFIDDCFCHEDADFAHEVAHKYFVKKYFETLEFYEFLKASHVGVKGYEGHADMERSINGMSAQQVADAYMEHAVYGTPDQVLEKLQARRKLVGNFQWATMLTGGGMPHSLASDCMKLMAKEVIPVVKGWTDEVVPQAVAEAKTLEVGVGNRF